MAIETVFLESHQQVRCDARSALQSLALTAIEDRPASGEVLLVDPGWAISSRTCAAGQRKRA